MESVLISLLCKERVVIVDTHISSKFDLSCIEVKYLKDQKCFMAVSFFTDTWIGKDLKQLIQDGSSMTVPSTVDDIANIREFTDGKSLKLASWSGEVFIDTFYTCINFMLLDYVKRYIIKGKCSKSLEFKVRVVLIPKLTVFIKIYRDSLYIGCISFKPLVGFTPIVVWDRCVYDIVDSVNECMLGFKKEVDVNGT